MQTLSEKVTELRDEAAKEGKLLPPLPDCHAPWCGSCNELRKYWRSRGIIIKCKDNIS